MIDILKFKNFLAQVFSSKGVYIDEFKPDLQTVEIDCFDGQPIKLVVELSSKTIKVSTIDREPAMDFSLYEYSFANVKEAEDFIMEISRTQKFPRKK